MTKLVRLFLIVILVVALAWLRSAMISDPPLHAALQPRMTIGVREEGCVVLGIPETAESEAAVGFTEFHAFRPANFSGTGLDARLAPLLNEPRYRDSVVLFQRASKIQDLIWYNAKVQQNYHKRHLLMAEKRRSLAAAGRPRRERTARNPITLVSDSGQFIWSHLFGNKNIINVPYTGSDEKIAGKCPVPCRLAFDRERNWQSADIILSWATQDRPSSPLRPGQIRAAIGLETDRCFWTSPDDCMQKFEIVIGYPRWSEVPANYFYAIQGELNKLPRVPDPSDTEAMRRGIAQVLNMGQTRGFTHPIWPKNVTEPHATTFISNCESWQRNLYIEDLMRFGIRINHYGGCTFGQERVSRDKDLSKTEIQSRSPFILAFENSILDDYFTEKYFQALMAPRSIVIYMGPRRIPTWMRPVLHRPFMIHALDYTPEELARFMLALVADSTAFEYFLEWKREERVSLDFASLQKQDFENVNDWLCRTCEFYHQHYDYEMDESASSG